MVLYDMPATPKPYVPRTQKARGLYAMLSASGFAYSIPILTPEATIPLGLVDDKQWPPNHFPMFARPCPIKPRHGFVESRVVRDIEELRQIIEETRAADPDGELMLCELINANNNAVWVPHLLTVGMGNDGATAGKDVVTFPLAGLIDPILTPKLLAQASISKDQDPYIEVVYDHKVGWITQLRAGPALSAAQVDYIPNPVQVATVVKVDPTMDLLAWEKLITELKDEVGVVVWHPGGSPADHFSVHARSFQIPVCITFEPHIGDQLEVLVGTPPLDPMGILEGIAVGESMSLPTSNYDQEAVNLLLHVLHNSSAIGGADSWWLGVGVAMMLRLGTIALRGEVRHLHQNSMPSRESVYRKAIAYSLQRQRSSIPRLINALRYGAFSSAAVGGIQWARCGKATADLFNAVGALARDPSPNTVGKLLRVFNLAVNQAHNGGWWLNKFIPSNAFDDIQVGSLKWTIKVAPFVHQVADWRRAVIKEPAKLKVHIATWSKWEAVSINPPAISAAQVVLTPGLTGLIIRVEDRLLRDKHKPIVISVGSLVTHLQHIFKGQLFVEESAAGLEVVFHPPHEDPITLWKEEDIDPKPNSLK